MTSKGALSTEVHLVGGEGVENCVGDFGTVPGHSKEAGLSSAHIALSHTYSHGREAGKCSLCVCSGREGQERLW